MFFYTFFCAGLVHVDMYNFLCLEFLFFRARAFWDAQRSTKETTLVSGRPRGGANRVRGPAASPALARCRTRRTKLHSVYE
jgi:hypothetical protein